MYHSDFRKTAAYAEMLAALAPFHGYETQTGGGCTAWEVPSGAVFYLITEQFDPSVPDSLSDPVALGRYIDDSGECDPTFNNGEPMAFDSMADALAYLRSLQPKCPKCGEHYAMAHKCGGNV